jgi:hypothetical protein
MYKRYYDIDVDAKAYGNNIVKAGGRIPSDIGSVSDFIRKLKQNNLWNSLSEAWFFRSVHNIGTGTIVYPLKDINNIATMVNGPVWSPAGIVFDGSNDYIICNSNENWKKLVAQKQISVFTICTCPSDTSGGGGIITSTTPNSDYIFIWIAPRTNCCGGEFRYGSSTNGSYSSLGENTSTGFNMWNSTGGVGKRTIGYRNATSVSSNGAASAGDTGIGYEQLPSNTQGQTLTFGRGAGYYKGTFSHCFIFNDYLSATDVTTVYNIVKSTISRGLNLP